MNRLPVTDNEKAANGPMPGDLGKISQEWATYLEYGNVSGAWVRTANLNILPDGNIPIAFGNTPVKLDGNTGLVLQQVALSTGPAPLAASNHKHLTTSLHGTLIMIMPAEKTG